MKIEAVLRWLEAHPTWLMILDNVDDDKAVAAVTKLMARLKGGHVIVTARAANFPASLRKLELDVLDEDAATAVSPGAHTRRSRDERMTTRRRRATIARELGGLALGLEQAGAYIATERIGFARYLKLWGESRREGARLVRPGLDGLRTRRLATTWATSVDRAFARKPPPARPARDAGAGPDSRFASRRRRSRRGGGL